MHYTYALLDVLEISRLFEPFDIPVQILHPVVQVRIVVPDHAQIEFKLLHIYRIKPHQRHIDLNVKLRKLLSQDVRTAVVVHNFFELVERAKDGDDVFIVRLLVFCEADFVHARIHIACDPTRYCVDPGLQVGWAQVYVGILLWQEHIEGPR